jgi:hypothetical protein
MYNSKINVSDKVKGCVNIDLLKGNLLIANSKKKKKKKLDSGEIDSCVFWWETIYIFLKKKEKSTPTCYMYTSHEFKSYISHHSLQFLLFIHVTNFPKIDYIRCCFNLISAKLFQLNRQNKKKTIKIQYIKWHPCKIER